MLYWTIAAVGCFGTGIMAAHIANKYRVPDHVMLAASAVVYSVIFFLEEIARSLSK